MNYCRISWSLILTSILAIGLHRPMQGQNFYGSAPINWNISFVELRDGLGGIKRLEGVGFRFDQVTENWTFGPNDTARLVTTFHATPFATQFHGIDYDLTVTFAPSGGEFVMDTGFQPLNAGNIIAGPGGAAAQLQASYEWVTGGQTYSDVFDINISLAGTTGVEGITFDNNSGLVELNHSFFGFFIAAGPTDLASATALNGLELNLSLGWYGGGMDHIGRYDDYFPGPIAMIPEPGCLALFAMGLGGSIFIRRRGPNPPAIISSQN